MYTIEKDLIQKSVVTSFNKGKKWAYGYNEKYDIVVISKDGTIGDIYNINGVKIALPEVPNSVENKGGVWTVEKYPDELKAISSMFEWNDRDNIFKSKWVNYIEDQFDRREYGHWFVNKKTPTYMTGTHWMYLQWSKTDVGLPDFRESNRIFFIYWEACKADNRCFGLCYLKNRRSGFSYMASCEVVNTGTLTKNGHLGIMSKTGPDAKSMFTDKVVPISQNYPFFFKPVQDGMDKPKTELSYKVPAAKITKKNMYNVDSSTVSGLDTVIDWRSTSDNAYDGEKLKLLIEDEAGKIVKPENILNGWRVRKTCLRLGSRIIGKCMMGSTSNALSKGGANYKKMYEDSNPRNRSANGQTKSGLYSLFIPMEWNFEGYIDKYGFPILTVNEGSEVENMEGDKVKIGVIEYWNNEVAALKSDSDALNEFYRQYPRTESHAFRDESKESLFNLTKIYQQIDYNDGLIKGKYLTRGYFSWMHGEKDTKVVWTPDPKGRFLVSWIPDANMQNNVIERNGAKYPGNEHLGSFGCDPYDISGVVGGGGSNGSLHGMTKFHMEHAPSHEFFLEYIARPQTAEIFFEDVLMACFFYGMPVLAENNKPRLLYHFKNRGYRRFASNRPDKPLAKLSVTEREIGGVPNNSEDMKQAHADAIQTYIEKYVGLDMEGTYRDPDEMGSMYFIRTLEDWAKFDINNRTKHDASISSGLAIMANQRHMYVPEVKKSKIIVNFATYDNSGRVSQIKKNEGY